MGDISGHQSHFEGLWEVSSGSEGAAAAVGIDIDSDSDSDLEDEFGDHDTAIVGDFEEDSDEMIESGDGYDLRTQAAETIRRRARAESGWMEERGRRRVKSEVDRVLKDGDDDADDQFDD